MTDSQRERFRDSKRRRLDSGPTQDQEPEPEELAPLLAPGGCAPFCTLANRTVQPQISWLTSPSPEFSGDTHGLEPSLEFFSPAPSLGTNEDSFEVQVQRLKDRLLENPGSRDTAVRFDGAPADQARRHSIG